MRKKLRKRNLKRILKGSNMGRSENDENPNLVPSGIIQLNSSATSGNGSANVTISNVAPAGVATATISKWLQVKDEAGAVFYIPMWT